MSKISVVYWSQSGNTAAMAEAVAKGVTDAGKEAEIVFVSSASIDELKSETAFALGCPAMGAEVLEEGEMEPFVQAYEAENDFAEQALTEEYHQGLITRRNRRMAEGLRALLEDGEGEKIFVTVGLLHLVLPEDSVLGELKAMGYQVEQVLE